MTEKWKDEAWASDIWYSGKVTRRSVVGWGGGAIGAMMLVPAPWRAAFGAAKPYKIGSEQPLSGPGALGGKTAVVGLQMSADRINKNGGINGRPVELVIADDESKPDVGAPQERRRWWTRTTSTFTSAASCPTSVLPACRCGRRPRSST